MKEQNYTDVIKIYNGIRGIEEKQLFLLGVIMGLRE